jgi:hypothetical protein
MPRHPKRNLTRKTESVFLNIPYDSPFENLYLAYIAGVSSFGLKPRAALEIPSSKRRLDRILDLIQDCAYSIHDLSRVELDRTPPLTPRFNMPFELGLTVALEKVAIPRHVWVVCESKRFRLKKSLTDRMELTPTFMMVRFSGCFVSWGARLSATGTSLSSTR